MGGRKRLQCALTKQPSTITALQLSLTLDDREGRWTRRRSDSRRRPHGRGACVAIGGAASRRDRSIGEEGRSNAGARDAACRRMPDTPSPTETQLVWRPSRMEQEPRHARRTMTGLFVDRRGETEIWVLLFSGSRRTGRRDGEGHGEECW